MSNIAVSVVVAVYNRENLLDRCIDSLVYQTMNDFEIILVDDQSEDASMEVMRRWQSLFPEKIVILSNPIKGVANAKNLGIRNARGKYITFVDSDDYVDYKMLEKLYQHAQEHDWPKLVHSPIWSVLGKKKWTRSTMRSSETIEDFLKLEAFFLPGKLFHRDLFAQFGLLPEIGIGEDVSWVFPVMSYLDKISYYDEPGYYYELSDNSVSAKKTEEWVIHDIIKGSERIIRETNPKYKEYALIYAFRRVINLSRNKTMFAYLINAYLLKNRGLLNEVEDLETKAPDLVQAMEKLSEVVLPIPRTVYLNGFGATDKTLDEACYREALGDDVAVVVLNETVCNVSGGPTLVQEAWKQGNKDFVGKYFALRECYRNGGIYIDDTVEIDASFVPFLYDSAFFGYESDNTISDRVFGADKGNPCVLRILQTYEVPELYEDPFAPLSARMKTVLVGMGNVTLLSDTLRRPEYGFCLYPVDMFVLALPYGGDMHVCHYKEGTFPEEPSVNVPVRVLKTLTESRIRIETQNRKNGDAGLQRRVRKLEKEVSCLKNSRSWKLTRPLRAVMHWLKKLLRSR